MRAFVGFGSNIDPGRNVLAAVRFLARYVHLVNVSTVYRTAPIDRPEQSPYWNGVIEIETDISPLELKNRVLRSIEDRLGRVRTGDRFASRTIDLDLILYDSLEIRTPELVLPDPEIPLRPFLAISLLELSPGLILPGSGIPIRDIAQSLPADSMEPLDGYTALLRKEILRGI